ncbi:MAG: hypothetical protein AUJ92_10525 [Armatimonadetes bacterium CG2_30_59_28]|nr:hypothetical protein [Armatimonadota bacterium]OIO94264.1 MAG: hypothetical protein AUJ92_10525 [Armatimonadetes bacterium CG2_30_59_28]PIU63112.1 MAG: hypothetical protein COS85_16725 [Armatimonadetes bacterium CG07_land_8_20_14_0_80_59_28]PIX40348.1 MAG: hypothetical protein COZ56_14955 [Armatimonadetes bacterium CG_4_8_14_3_um_filter_58_9]PIY43654.1 MAG: hypothetical protein COZ05_10435 [Armatimonadetes bacterium CG_4_10_14_3_um_filter_59_10]PJB71608.1 MAG: hypothetical protein CO095_079
MKKSEPELPEFGSLDELVEFFDTHDMGDYLDRMPEARFEVDFRGTSRLFSLDNRLARKIDGIARTKQLSVDELIGSWIEEKVLEYSHT